MSDTAPPANHDNCAAGACLLSSFESCDKCIAAPEAAQAPLPKPAPKAAAASSGDCECAAGACLMSSFGSCDSCVVAPPKKKVWHFTPAPELLHEEKNPLDADVLRKQLIARAETEPRLQPLLPLLHDPPQQLTQPVFVDPSASSKPKPIPTKPFVFDEGNGLEDWEVHEILDAETQGPQRFKNWVGNVAFEPSSVLLVRSIEGARRVVVWAKKAGKKLRVAGYRHTWSDLWNESGDVIVTFVHPDARQSLPYSDPPSDWKTELVGVSLVPNIANRTPEDGHAFARVLAGTSNNQFREWSATSGYSLPFNVVVTEVTFGGSIATICHGAGMGTPTLSDLVEEVCYIDANGVDQVVNDPEELKCAAGAFGFLGVVTSIVLRVELATVAEMRPTQVPLVLAIPPPEGFTLPEIVERQVKEAGITKEDMEKARKDFVRRAEEDHFHEFFWYPYQKCAWLNTWQRRPLTDADKDLPTYPQFGIPDDDFAAQDASADLATDIGRLDTIPAAQQTYAFGLASLAGLPNIQSGGKPLTTRTSEALHFRGGSQLFPFYGMEWELPMPPSKTGEKRDYTMIQQAWWDAITIIYNSPNAPLRAALEMRLTNGSDILLAAQRGNQTSDLGTASLEVFTLLSAPAEEWRTFRQAVVDKWTAHAFERSEELGGRRARPHWNKQWADLQVQGKPVAEYLREDAYKEAFGEFREALKGIHEKRGSTVKEARKLFSNKLMEGLIWNDLA